MLAMPGPTPILGALMSLAAADPLFIAFQQALSGRYSIDRELGRGGMGIVYLAHEVHLDRLVAIKLLPPERGRQPEVRDRFLREARLAAKLSHPNIIPIHAVEELGGFVYYVMAFVDGDTLSSRVRARGPMPASEGARLRARPGAGPSRCETGEHPDRRRDPPGAGCGFWNRRRGRRRHRWHLRHAGVHESRAGTREAARRAERLVFARRDGVLRVL